MSNDIHGIGTYTWGDGRRYEAWSMQVDFSVFERNKLGSLMQWHSITIVLL